MPKQCRVSRILHTTWIDLVLLLLLEMTKTRDNPPEYYPATRIVCRGREEDQKLCFCVPSKEEFLKMVATEKVHTTKQKRRPEKRQRSVNPPEYYHRDRKSTALN